MPNCIVRYHVRLVPRTVEARPMDAVAIFTEDRMPNERGEPGTLLSRHLDRFSGPAGDAIREMMVQDDGWDMDVQDRIGPLEWEGTETIEGVNDNWRVAKKPAKRRRWLF